MYKEIETPVLEILPFDHAKDFLDALSPRAARWIGKKNSIHYKKWIFRGQRDAEWGLVPSAYRLDKRKRFGMLDDYSVEEKSPKSFALNFTEVYEFDAVAKFSEYADRMGLEVPDYEISLSRWSETCLANTSLSSKVKIGPDKLSDPEEVKKYLDYFPPKQYREMFALAQHYGIPTRLLDWSECSNTAAYFAASDAMRHVLSTDETSTKNNKIAVWALKTNNIETMRNELGEGVSIVTARWHKNPNLRAQKGIFTLYDQLVHGDNPPKPLDQCIKDIAIHYTASGPLVSPISVPPILLCFTLPISEVKNLLYLLALENVNASTLFPGFTGAAMAVEEQKWWEEYEFEVC